MTQNENGSATAPTVPSHGPNIPHQETKMNRIQNSIAPAEAPVPKPTHEQIADAMADLEAPLLDLGVMASITSDFASEWLGRPMAYAGEKLVFHVSKMQREKCLFAINDLETRIGSLKSAYMLARSGEGAQ
jgi:hypothetical protein